MSVLTINCARHATQVSADYLELVAKAALRPITTDAEYDRATAIIEKLALRPKLSRGQKDYLDAMIVFIEGYEESEPDPAKDVSPVEMIKALMEHRGMTTSELGQLLGSKSAASEILHGK